MVERVTTIRRTRPEGEERFLLREGILGGLVAGVIFAVVQMIVAGAAGMGAMAPWRMFASIVAGRGALVGEMTFGLFLLGFIVHFVLSALFGMIWGAIARGLPYEVRTSWGQHAAGAMAFGFVLWLVNFQVIARVAYPWFLGMNQLAQVLLHVLAFGLPLGLYLVARLRPGEPIEMRRRVTV